jgi:hypothetical protein
MLKALALATAVSFAFIAPAKAQTDSFANCLADNTTGKERKLLARWIFTAMAAHPEIKDLANVTPQASDEVSRELGALVTRLLAESCKEETKAVAAKGNAAVAMRTAFENLGRLAMAEIMSNPDVSAAIGKFEPYMDKAKLQAALSGK